MSIIKKIAVTFLAAALALSMAACGDSAEEAAPAESSAPPSSSAPEPSSAPSAVAPAPAGSRRNVQQLESTLVEAYIGVTENGEGIYYAGDATGDTALLMFFDPEGGEHYVFSGPIVDNGNGTVTITDDADGLTLTFGVEESDGALVIDMGDDLGYAVMGEATVDEVIEIMLQIESNTPAAGTTGSGDEEYYIQDVSITNNTGVVIMELYISPSESDQWGNDLMGADVFGDGETLQFSTDLVGTADATWDIRIVDEDGDDVTFTGVNLSAATTLSLSWGSDGQTPTVTFS